MNEVLIISDNLEIAYNADMRFSNAGWSSKNISVLAMMAQSSASTNHYQCIVLVVDINLLKRFGRVVEEMSALIRNFSKHSPMYLVFEAEYDSYFESWIKHAKRTFNLIMHEGHLQNAITEIIRMESGCVPVTSFCSPMSSI